MAKPVAAAHQAVSRSALRQIFALVVGSNLGANLFGEICGRIGTKTGGQALRRTRWPPVWVGDVVAHRRGGQGPSWVKVGAGDELLVEVVDHRHRRVL